MSHRTAQNEELISSVLYFFPLLWLELSCYSVSTGTFVTYNFSYNAAIYSLDDNKKWSWI